MAWSHRTLKHIKQELKYIKIVKQHALKRNLLIQELSGFLLFNDTKIYLKQDLGQYTKVLGELSASGNWTLVTGYSSRITDYTKCYCVFTYY